MDHRVRCFPCNEPKKALTCDGGYPCTNCKERGDLCGYPPLPEQNISTPWGNPLPEDIEWTQPVYLSRKRPEKFTDGAIDEELQLVRHPDIPVDVLFPPVVPQSLQHGFDQLPPSHYKTDEYLAASLFRKDDIAFTEPRNNVYNITQRRNLLSLTTVNESYGPASWATWAVMGSTESSNNRIECGRFATDSKLTARRHARTKGQKSTTTFSHAFVPSREAFYECSTPSTILQISNHPIDEDSKSIIAYRTSKELEVMYVDHLSDTAGNQVETSKNMRGSVINSSTVPIVPTVEFRQTINARDHLRKTAMVDFALGGPSGGDLGSGLVLDARGGLYGWGLGTRGTSRFGSEWNRAPVELFQLRKRRRSVHYSGFGRLSWGGTRKDSAILALENEVVLLDLRTPSGQLGLLDSGSLLHPTSTSARRSSNSSFIPLVTSILQPTNNVNLNQPLSEFTPCGIHVVCTTRDIIWVDQRMPNRSMLSWNHGYTHDRTLELLKIPTLPSKPEHHRLALTSLKHSNIDIYSYTAPHDNIPTSLSSPYSIEPPRAPTIDKAWTRTGIQFTVYKASTASEPKTEDDMEMVVDTFGYMLLESGLDGSLHSRHYTVGELEAPEEEEKRTLTRRLWPKRTEILAHQSEQVLFDEKPTDVKQSEVAKKTSIIGKLGQTYIVARPGFDDTDLTNLDFVSELKDQQDRLTIRELELKCLGKLFSSPPSPYLLVDNRTSLREHIISAVASLGKTTTPIFSKDNGAKLFGILLGTLWRWTGSIEALQVFLQKEFFEIYGSLIPQIKNDKMRAILSEERRQDRERFQELCAFTAASLAESVLLLDSPPIEKTLDKPFARNKPWDLSMEPPIIALSELTVKKESPIHLDSVQDRDGEPPKAKQEAINAPGVRLLLAEWELGSDVSEYEWTNPYIGSLQNFQFSSQFTNYTTSTARVSKNGSFPGSVSQPSKPLSSSLPPTSQPHNSFFSPSQASSMFPQSQVFPQVFSSTPSQASPFFTQPQTPANTFGLSQTPAASQFGFNSQPFSTRFGPDKKRKRVSGF